MVTMKTSYKFAMSQSIALAVALNAIYIGVAGAESIWFSYHSASGSGWADVFDADGAQYGSGNNVYPDNPLMVFGASDDTQFGSMGASALANGESRITPYEDNGMHIKVELVTHYHPSLFLGGDNPGGEAHGQLQSVIEFVMPVDELPWYYMLDIDDTVVFDGSANVVIENVTQSQTLLTLTSHVNPPIETTLVGHTGDLIRITSVMSGGGTTGPASDRFYGADFETLFLIPEPATALLLLVGAMCLCRRVQRPRPHLCGYGQREWTWWSMPSRRLRG